MVNVQGVSSFEYAGLFVFLKYMAKMKVIIWCFGVFGVYGVYGVYGGFVQKSEDS